MRSLERLTLRVSPFATRSGDGCFDPFDDVVRTAERDRRNGPIPRLTPEWRCERPDETTNASRRDDCLVGHRRGRLSGHPPRRCGGDPPADGTLTLETASATPGTTVSLSSIPAELGEWPRGWLYDATVDEPGEDDRHPAFVDVDHEVLFVPPHPGDYMGGGEATIEIESQDGEHRYGPFPFEVEPLSPAPGTLETALDEFEAALVEAGESLGYGRAELLAARPLSLAPPVVGVATALQGISADGHENNVRALLTGDAPMADRFEEDDAGWEVAEAMLYEAGMLDVSATIADQLTSIEADLDGVGWPEPTLGRVTGADATTGALGDPSAALSAGERAWPAQPSSRATGGIVADPVDSLDPGEVTTVLDLHRLMVEQARFADLNIGMENFHRNARNLGIAAAGFIPGAQKPAAAAGVLAFLEGLMVDLGEGTLPSEFTEFDLDAAPRTYLEDEYDVEGRTNAGQWEAALSAHSEGWVFDWGDVLDLVPINAGAFARQLDNHLGEVSRLTDTGEKLIEYMGDMVWEAFELDADTGPVEIPSQVYGPVEVDISRESDVELLNWYLRHLDQEADLEPFAFIGEGEQLPNAGFAPDERYEPQAVGRSELRVETVPDNFGGEYVSAEPVELEVVPIEVAIEDGDGMRPEIIRLDPEEDDMTLQLRAVVENAVNDEAVEWRHEVIAGPAIPAPSPSSTDQTVATVDLTGVDASGSQTPQYVIEVESATEEGLRADRDPARTARVTILVTDEDRELVVEPHPGCLDLDETHQLSVTLDGQPVDLDDLTWWVEGDGDGDITPNGTFVPSAAGVVELEFWLDDDRDVNGGLTFAVSEECNELYVEVSEGANSVSHSYTCVDSHGFPGDESALSQLSTKPERWSTGAEIELRLEIPFVYLPDLPLEEPQQVSGYVTLDDVEDDTTRGKIRFGTAVDHVPVTITRRIVPEGALDGSDLQVFDGEFGPHTQSVGGDNPTIEGHFTGVGWFEDRCGGYLVGPHR